MNFIKAIIPSLGVLFIFWVAIRAMINADRSEREAEASYERASREQGDPAEPNDTV